MLRAQVDDAGEIDFVHAVHVSAGAARLDHALGDELRMFVMGTRSPGNGAARDGRGELDEGADARCAGAANARRPELRSLALDEGHDVLLGDAAAKSGAGHLREADAVLAGDLAHERRGAGFFVFLSCTAVCGSGAARDARLLRFFLFFAAGWRRSCRRGIGGGGSGFAIDGDGADYRVHSDGRAFGDFDFLQNSRGGSGNFGVDFVGGDFKQRFVALNLVARLFQPLGNSALDDGFAHLGHDDVSRHDFLPRGPRFRIEGRTQTNIIAGWDLS